MTAFARFVTSSGLTNLADGVAVVAWAWLATLMTRDPLWVALVPIALRLPWFLFALPAGIVTDRVDRRRLILAMDAVRAVGFAVAAVVIWSALPLPDAPVQGVAQPAVFAIVLVAALTVGTAEVFRDNAAQTMLPRIVPPEDLEQANGRLWSAELVGNALLGPAVGAFLIAWWVPLPFVLNMVIYAVAIALILSIPGQFAPEPSAAPRDWRAELKAGVRFLRDAPLLRDLALITGFWNLFFTMTTVALVLHVQENMGLGATAYGLILAAGAVGGILAGVVAARIVGILGQARTAQWMLVASPLAFAGMVMAPGPVALALVLAAFEFTGLVWNTVSVSYRQRAIPDALLGRVNSVYRLLAWGMMPVGLLLSGLIVRVLEGPLGRSDALVAPFVVAAVGAAILAALGWRAIGRGFAGQS